MNGNSPQPSAIAKTNPEAKSYDFHSLPIYDDFTVHLGKSMCQDIAR